jgi:hypothetical protein
MKTRRYIGMVVSGILIVVILLIFTDPWSTLRNDGKRLILHQPGAVDRIVLTDSYDSTSLVLKEGRWWLFGAEEANQVAVENLLFAASKLQINSIQNEQLKLDDKGRKIQFFSGKRQVLNYELFTNAGAYLIRPEGSSNTFYVSVSGYTGLELANIFSTSSNHYRQHLLIDLLPSEISLIGIELGRGEAFRFAQDSLGNVTCMPSDEVTVIPSSEPDELAIRLLLSYFTAIRYERPSGIMREELLGRLGEQGRMARLHVESFRGEKHTLEVYPYFPSPGDQPDMFRALVLYNDEPEALVVNYIYLDVLMRDLSHYF